MPYTVVWVRAAEEALAELWTQAVDRDQVSQAANAIDARLRRSPETAGESRAEELRILLVPPLGVTFHIDPGARLVQVVDVWSFKSGDK